MKNYIKKNNIKTKNTKKKTKKNTELKSNGLLFIYLTPSYLKGFEISALFVQYTLIEMTTLM